MLSNKYSLHLGSFNFQPRIQQSPSVPAMTAVTDSGRRSRKKLPDIPPEELALHGKTSSEAASRHRELPPEVQAQFIKHVHRRSRSLTGLDTVEFEKLQQVEAEKENVEPAAQLQNIEASQHEQLITKEDEIPNVAKSLPTTPGICY